MNTNGIILLNKRSGYTSFQELTYLKRNLGISKLGHGGTLDKFAEGMLVVLTGYMTRFNQYLLPLEKTYIGTFHFGKETETLDPEGSIISEAEVPSRQSVLDVLDQFRGTILQQPPVYSAVHIDGKRAYRAAREGKQLDMPYRSVQIYDLEMLSWNPPEAVFSIRCSKGTYIRSLARDIARAAGSRAYVSALTRTAVGPFSLDETVPADRCTLPDDMLSPLEGLSRALSVEQADALPSYERILSHGSLPQLHWLDFKEQSDDHEAVIALSGTRGLIGWYLRKGEEISAIYVLQEASG